MTIGFSEATYTFTETDGAISTSVTVSVQGSTTLARDVVVTVQTVDGTATGAWGSLTYTDIVHVSFMCYHFSLQLHPTTHLCPWT